MFYSVIVLIAVTLVEAAHAVQEPRKAGELLIEPASLLVPGMGDVAFELGTIFVPENRGEPTSRVIGVGFARFRASAEQKAPPIFLLPGGPGRSFVSDLKASNPALERIMKDLSRLRQISDVVLVDQRGFSERGDVLTFRATTAAEPIDEPANLARSIEAYQEIARSATAEFAGRGIDLAGYTVKECADDVNDLRRLLSYDQIMLMGGSFGSQWSFAIMRRHPQIVARAALAGVEPLDCGYDMPSHIMAAVQRMWWEAEQDETLEPYLPPGGLTAAARKVLERLEQSPIRVQLKGVRDVKTGEPTTVVLGPEDFQQDVLLRGPTQGPASILALYHGHYDSWAFAASIRRRRQSANLPVIPPLIDSSLGVTPRRRFLLENDPATRFLGQWNFAPYLATADIWPSPDVGDDFRTEIVSPIPVVFVNGDWDTQTPVENMLQVAPYFSKGHVLVVERGGHGAMQQIARDLPETYDALLKFLETGATDQLPTRVTLPPQQFSAPNFPPPNGS